MLDTSPPISKKKQIAETSENIAKSYWKYIYYFHFFINLSIISLLEENSYS